METQTNISIISRTRTIVLCTILSGAIALFITMIGKLNFHEFMINILDWQSM